MRKAILSNLGVDITEATIIRIIKYEGGKVLRGDAIAEVETQKVTFEVVSPIDGIVLKLLHKEGDTVSVGDTIAIIGDKNEDISEFFRREESINDNREKIYKKREKNDSSLNKIKAIPSARKLAKELNVKLENIKGTGPEGLITKEDVVKYASTNENDVLKVIPFLGRRNTIAKRMSESLHTAAHVTSIIDIDISEIKEKKKQIEKKKNLKISYIAFFIKAAVFGIKNVPVVNSIVRDNKIIVKKNINFSIAISVEDGLLVPVIKDVENMDLVEISEKIKELSNSARDNKLTVENFKDGTITISNGGVFGPIMNTPIINQPQVAIIWIGRIHQKLVVVKGEIKIRDIVYLCMSYDHRVLDGKDAGNFLKIIKTYLERNI